MSIADKTPETEPLRRKSDAEALTEKRIGAGKPEADETASLGIGSIDEMLPQYQIGYWRALAEMRVPDWLPIATLIGGFLAGFGFGIFIANADLEKRFDLDLTPAIRPPMLPSR